MTPPLERHATVRDAVIGITGRDHPWMKFYDHFTIPLQEEPSALRSAYRRALVLLAARPGAEQVTVAVRLTYATDYLTVRQF